MSQAPGASRIELVTTHLNRLLEGYRQLLVAPNSLPALGRVNVEIEKRSEEPSAATSRRRRRWVSRLLVRLYAEVHVRRQLRHIVCRIDREALRVGRDEETLRYRELRTQLQEHADRITTWPGLTRIIRALPVVPPTTALVAAWWIGVGANRPRATDVAVAVIALILLVVNLHILLVAPSIRLGFRTKRALFNGGVTDMGPLVMGKEEALGSRILWTTLPKVNGYRLEDEVFRALGWAKRREIPLDLLLSLPHFGSVVTAAVFFGAASTTEDPEEFWGSLLLALAFVLVEAMLIRGQWHTYRRRRSRAEI